MRKKVSFNNAYMKIYALILASIFGGLLQSCTNNPSDTQKPLQIDTTTVTQSESKDELYKQEIAEADKKFRISDKAAIRLINQVKELKEIVDWEYKDDSTITNEVIIDGVPNDSIPDWVISINQNQPRIPISNRIITILVNANNGKIRIWDVPNDTILTLDAWRKRKGK